MEKKWYRTDLKPRHADKLKVYLKENDIYFEPSEARDDYIHFEVLMEPRQVDQVNGFLDTIFGWMGDYK